MKMEIFLINLERRPDRLAFMDSQLKDLGLPYTRINAIDGLGAAEIGYPENHKRLSKGEYACYLSHVKVWDAFLASGAPRCLLLEDDLTLARSLPQILAHEPFFNHNGKLTRLECRIFRTRVAKIWRHRFLGRKLRKITAYDGGTGAIVLTRAYAQYLRAHHAAPKIPVDDLVLDPASTSYKPRAVYQLDPAPAIQSMFLEGKPARTYGRSDLQRTRAKPAAPPPPSSALRVFFSELSQLGKNVHTNLFHISKTISFRDD